MTEKSKLTKISAALALLETGLAIISGAALAAIMMIVVVDVIMRYVLSAPLSWSYDLIGLYLVVAVFFFSLSDTMHHHGHISIDLFQHMIPHRLRHALLSVGYLFSTVIVAMIGWQAWLRFMIAYSADDRIAAVVPWPTWIAYSIVTLGSLVLALRCAYRMVGHAASAATGKEMVEMPPPPDSTPANVGVN
ncbi:MAG: TRAP transporter small permease [Rhodobacteraceae bacterium]|nr:TRAP transporter small permease [Paracoccaceae bacterium]